MRILFFTDTHIRFFSPVNRKDNFQEAIFTKLEEVVQIANEHNVDLVVHGGDLFDRYDVTNKLLGRTAALLRQFKCPIYVLPGNHDIVGYSVETLPSTSLDVLAKSGVIKLLLEPQVIDDVLLYPIPSSADIPESSYRIERGAARVVVIVAHDNLLPQPVHKDIPHKVISDSLSNADIVLLGHWHPGWPEPVKAGSTLYVNPGSIARLDIGPGSRDRRVQVVLIDINDSVSVQYVPLSSARPYDEVFVEVSSKHTADLEDVGKAINTASSDIPVVDVFSMLAEMDVPDELRAVINEKLDTTSQASDACWTSDLVHISEVELTNFQSHADTKLRLAPGLNVIVGPSDSGKSAVLRALWWLFYNKPKGADFVRIGSKSASVKAVFSSGSYIERSRTRSSSGSYTYRVPGSEPVELKGFGSTLPPEVVSIHKTPLLTIAGEDVSINIARQFDPPFMLGSGPSFTISLLDVMTRNDVVFEAIKQLKAELQATKTVLPQYQELLDKQNKAIASLEQLLSLSDRVEQIEHELMRLVDDCRKLIRIRDLYNGWIKLKESSAERLQALQELQAKAERLDRMLQEAERAAALLSSKHVPFAQGYNQRITQLRRLLPQLSTAQLANAYKCYVELIRELNVCPLCGGAVNTSGIISEITSQYEAIVDQVNRIAKEVMGMTAKEIKTAGDDVMLKVRALRSNFESACANLNSAIAVAAANIDEAKKLEQQCQEEFGVDITQFETLMNDMQKSIEQQLGRIQQELEQLKQQYTALLSSVKEQGVL